MATFSPTGRMLVARGLYRRWLSKYFSTITLAGLAPDDEPILLKHIYVPLVLTPEKVSDYAHEEEIQRGGRILPFWLQEILGEAVLFISGEAGSGKSTLVSSIVDSLAGETQDDLNLQFEDYVPFPIRLREPPLEKIDSLDSLVDWWLKEVKRETPDLEPEDLKSFLEKGRGIILLDGLDEVGSIQRRARLLEWLREHRWIPGSETPTSNLVIVTARPSGFEGLLKKRLPSNIQAHVAPFSRQQIRLYLSRWFELRSLRTGQRQETVNTLLIRLTARQQSQRLLPLARRPAYLASLAFVHGTRGELPYSRAALYELLVDAYIEMLDRQRGLLDRAERTQGLPIWDRQEKVEVLSAVAFQAHIGSTASKERLPDRRILWSRQELKDAVCVAIEDGAERFRTVRFEHATLLTDYFVARTGLLVETREGLFQFGHLSFQEYLTALFLLNRATAGSDKAGELERILFPRLELPGWLEVGVLVLAIDAGRSGGKGHAPVLARLNLYNRAQFSLLAQILSGEELRFTKAERHAWVFVFLGFKATASWEHGAIDNAFLFPANQEAIAIAWLAWIPMVEGAANSTPPNAPKTRTFSS